MNMQKISSLVDCGQPVAPQHGSLESYTNTTVGSEVFYICNQYLVPEGRMRAVCTDSGWNSNPADLICTEGMLGDCQHPLFGSKPHNYQTRVGGWLVLIMCVMSKVDMK